MERMGTMERKQLSGLKIVPRHAAPARPAVSYMDPIPPPGTVISPTSSSPPHTVALVVPSTSPPRQMNLAALPSSSPPKHSMLPPPPSSSPPRGGLLSPRGMALPPPPPVLTTDSPNGAKAPMLTSPSKKALAKLASIPPPLGPLPPPATAAPTSAAPVSPRSAAQVSPRAGPVSPGRGGKDTPNAGPLFVSPAPIPASASMPVVGAAATTIAASKSGHITPLTKPIAMLKASGPIQRSASPAPGPMTRLAPGVVENRSSSAPRQGPGHQALAKLPPPPILPPSASGAVLPAPIAKPPAFKAVK